MRQLVPRKYAEAPESAWQAMAPCACAGSRPPSCGAGTLPSPCTLQLIVMQPSCKGLGWQLADQLPAKAAQDAPRRRAGSRCARPAAGVAPCPSPNWRPTCATTEPHEFVYNSTACCRAIAVNVVTLSTFTPWMDSRNENRMHLSCDRAVASLMQGEAAHQQLPWLKAHTGVRAHTCWSCLAKHLPAP